MLVVVGAASSVQAALLTPVSTSQNVLASGTIEEAGSSYTDSDPGESLDSVSYSKNVSVALAPDGVTGQASASASIVSTIGAETLSVTGAASAFAQSGPSISVSDTAQADGTSQFIYKFQVSAPASYELSGSVSGIAPEGGPASYANYVHLRIDGGAFLFSNPTDNDPFAASGTLSPGVTYELAGYADTSSFDFLALGSGASAGYGFSFAVSPVPEPHEYALMAGLALIGFGIVRRTGGRKRN